MEKRFTREEKGKGVAKQPEPTHQTRLRIRAPEIDNSDLIRENALTLIGRVTNPGEQRIWSVIPYLSRRWSLKTRAEGSDLGNNCFQFHFENDEDLKKVLDNRPYVFNRWMVILQQWEPIISPTFPVQIPFWIRLRGIPLHFWKKELLQEIGEGLGKMDGYELTKTMAKIRVILDGMQPLIKETVLEFSNGEEAIVTLEYERLALHCSYCRRLTHERKECPELMDDTEPKDPYQADSTPKVYDYSTSQRTLAYDRRTTNKDAKETRSSATTTRQTSYNQGREDRERLPTRWDETRRDNPREDEVRKQNRASNQGRNYALTKTHSDSHGYHRSRQRQASSPSDGSRNLQEYIARKNRATEPQYPNLEWRERSDNQVTPDSQRSRRPPLERNLETVDFPHPNRIPTTEEVMEELQEVTFNYTNVPNLVERAARQQRVTTGEETGLMAQTAAKIIATATSNYPKETVAAATSNYPNELSPTTIQTNHEETNQDLPPHPKQLEENQGPIGKKKRGRPPLSKRAPARAPADALLPGNSSRKIRKTNHIQISPRVHHTPR